MNTKIFAEADGTFNLIVNTANIDDKEVICEAKINTLKLIDIITNGEENKQKTLKEIIEENNRYAKWGDI